MELNNEKYKIETENNLNSYITININCFITNDDYNIYLWDKDKLNPVKFSKVKKITLENKIYNFLNINNKCLVFSQKTKINFYKS